LTVGSTPRRSRRSWRPSPGPGRRDVTIDIDRLESIDGAGWLGVIACEQHVSGWGGRLRIDDGIRKILDLASS
jgi:hypothetical protein